MLGDIDEAANPCTIRYMNAKVIGECVALVHYFLVLVYDGREAVIRV